MRIITNILMGLVLVALVVSFSACCCTGGLDDSNLNPTEHDQGYGG
jgi:hypothetical protein